MKDPALEAVVEDQGWVVVPLLSADEVAELTAFYHRHASTGELNPPGAFNPTYAEFTVIHSSPDFRAEAYDTIVEVVGRRAAPLLDGYRPIVANFVNKLPGQGVVPMHQNWSVVDETRFRSLSVWVALVDCDGRNGALEMLAGSHRVFDQPRGMWAYEAFSEVAEDLRLSMVQVDVRAGDAVILDDALVHYSPPNSTPDDRLAIQLIMVPEQAPARFYQRVDSNDDEMVVDVWEVDHRFFFDFWHGAGDTRFGQVIERVTLPSSKVDAATISRLGLDRVGFASDRSDGSHAG